MMFVPSYPTPHIDAAPGDFAKTVLMPGDPLRAKWIAERFLQDPVAVNNVRGVQGYTGLFAGKRVSVMASGMGMPSIGIYSYELFTTFGVETILRVGSAGGYDPEVRVRDLILAQGACTDSHFPAQYRLGGTFAPIADFSLLRKAAELAEQQKIPFHVGNVLSTDVFYPDEEGLPQSETAAARWGKMGVLAVEMEAAALYATAARCRKKALAILTVSDHLVTGEALSAAERQESFSDMITLALSLGTEAEA